MKRWLPPLLLLPALLVLGACSTNPATGEQSFTAFMSPEKEMQVGAEEHPKILEQFGGAYGDRELAAYVRDMGLRLAAQSEMPDLPWTFTVLNDTKVNAFALPGGYIYVTRGLLALASDEAELAGVLSHEIGHVTARHTAQRYSTAVTANIGVQVLGVLSQAAGLGRMGGDIAALGANVALRSYSREQELESDMLGVRYMVRLGYDPQALVSFFEKLRTHQALEAKMAGADENAVDQHNIMSTHPRTGDRIQQAIDLSEKNGTVVAERNATAYLGHIDGLVFGDAPEQGIVRGRTFTHTELNFRFEVPEGFKIINTPDLVLATHDNGAVIKFAGAPAEEVRKLGGMRRFLTEGWGGGLQLKNVEWLEVNGMSAVTGVARVWTGRENIDVRRIILEQGRDAYWRFQFETPVRETASMNLPLRETTYSFRAPTPSEVAAAKPYRVHVVEVGRGVTADDMIAAMGLPDYNGEWFEALNGVASGDTLQPGQKIKLVK